MYLASAAYLNKYNLFVLSYSHFKCYYFLLKNTNLIFIILSLSQNLQFRIRHFVIEDAMFCHLQARIVIQVSWRCFSFQNIEMLIVECGYYQCIDVNGTQSERVVLKNNLI